MHIPLTLRSASVLLVSGLALSAQAVVFGDDFSLAQVGLVNSSANAQVGSPGSVTLPDGTGRVFYTSNYSNALPGFADSKASIHSGYLSFSSDDEVSDLADCGYAFTTPRDISTATGIRVDFLSLDIADRLDIRGFDANFAVFDAFVMVPASLTPFSVTLNNVFAGADVTKIKILDITLGTATGTGQAPAGRDARIDAVQAVPEPSALLATTLTGATLIRRRRR